MSITCVQPLEAGDPVCGPRLGSCASPSSRRDPDRPCSFPEWRVRQYLLNSGGPSSRTRTERIHLTVLGREEGAIRCPRVERVGIDFGRRHPLVCVRQWLKKAGFADETGARAALPLPSAPCICRVDPAPRPVAAGTLSPTEGLYHALVLGLCTPFLYNPERPILWTEASLTRQLLLYDGGGFYV